MDIQQKALIARLLAQAQTGSPAQAGSENRISGDQLARALTPELRLSGLSVQERQLAGTLAKPDVLYKMAVQAGLDISNLVKLLQAAPQTARLQGIHPTTKHEAIGVLKELLQSVASQKTLPASSTKTQTKTAIPPRARLLFGHASAPQNSLAMAVNLSVASLYLNNKMGVNRMLQVLSYFLRQQNLEPVQSGLNNTVNPGSFFPHSPSIFPFHTLMNKRRRRRAKSKRRAR